MAEDKIRVGNIEQVSGDVNIAGRDIYKGYTAEQVSVLLTQITSTFQPKPFDGYCPYKGLDVFEEEDAELFFGRERLVEDLVSRVKASRVTFIIGPSGSGKSSLLRAGLVPALKQGAIKDLHSQHWLYGTMNPGREPIEALSLVFSRLKLPELGKYFRQQIGRASVLHDCAESILSDRKTQHFVLFIDQFEEIFTQVSNETERLAFLNLLAYAATVKNGRVILLFSMRSDFVPNCATYPQLNALFNQQSIQIGSMQPHELVSAIAQPTLRVGLRIDPDLIAHIINDMKDEPGELPLMQFALKDLFDSQQAKGGMIALKLEDYLRHGGVQKSLERHADNSFAKLSGNEQELARSIFSGLIEIGRGTADTRRTALFDELIPANTNVEEVKFIVQELADARLITTDSIKTTDKGEDKETVTLSHEKLIDAWPWLKKLVEKNRDAIALQNKIADDAKEWFDHDRDASYLYTGARLANAREQLEAKKLVLSDLAQTFVNLGVEIEVTEHLKEEAQRQKELDDARRLAETEAQRAESEKHRAEEQTRSATKLRQQARYLIMALIAALIAVGVAIFFGIQSWQQARVALARQLAVKSQSISGVSQISSALLAVQSMKIFPNPDAASILETNSEALVNAHMDHEYSVYSVAFSPDSKYVVSGSGDGIAHVWEAATGKEVARMTHNSYVSSLAFSPDGKYVASGSGDNTARVWEATTGKEIARMTHDGDVTSVAFSPDGKYVVSGSYDCTARVWEATTGKEIVFMTRDCDVRSVAFSPDGEYVVSGGRDNTARVWEAATGKEIARMTHDGYVSSVTFSPDGKYVISGGCDKEDTTYLVCILGSARVWDARTGAEITHMIHSHEVLSVGFSPDGKYVVSGSGDNTARVWKAQTGKEIARMTHDGDVTSVAFSPDSKYVVSGSGDGTARVWSAMTGKEVVRMTQASSVDTVAFSPDGKYVVTGGCDQMDTAYYVCIRGSARVWIWRPEDLITEVCSRLNHNLNHAEWYQYIGDALPYQAICLDSPIESELISTP